MPYKSTGRPTKRTIIFNKKVKRLMNSHSSNAVSRFLSVSRKTIQNAAKDMNLKVSNFSDKIYVYKCLNP